MTGKMVGGIECRAVASGNSGGIAATKPAAEGRVGSTGAQAVVERARSRLEGMVGAVENCLRQLQEPSGHIVKPRVEDSLKALSAGGLTIAALLVERDGANPIAKRAVTLIREHSQDECSKLLAEDLLGKIAQHERAAARPSAPVESGWSC